MLQYGGDLTPSEYQKIINNLNPIDTTVVENITGDQLDKLLNSG
jgi:hypothetical protein